LNKEVKVEVTNRLGIQGERNEYEEDRRNASEVMELLSPDSLPRAQYRVGKA
jgi:hypothetical protein